MHHRKHLLALAIVTATWGSSALGQVPVRTEDHRLEPRGRQLETYDWYGSNVALNRDRAAVASKGDGTLAPGAGSVTIYTRETSGWQILQKLLPSDVAPAHPPLTGPYNKFGHAMVMEGEWLFVGAPMHDLPTINNGAVYTYRWNGAAYVFSQKIQAPTPGFLGQFGNAIALVGDLLYIGAPSDHEGGDFFGAIYTFGWSGSSWGFLHKTTNTELDYRAFGSVMALDGDLLAVSSINWVSVMRIGPAGQLTRIQTLYEPYGPSDFGVALAMDDGVLAVGHPRWAAGPVIPGEVHMFRMIGGAFQLEQTLRGDGLTPSGSGNAFGTGVALRNGTLVASAPGAFDPATGAVAGRAFVYEYDGLAWTEMERLEGAGCCEATLMEGVALRDGTILIGARNLSVHGIPAVGGALVFERPFGGTVCEGQTTSSGVPAQLEVLGMPVVGANALTLRASGLPGPGLAVFLAGQSAGTSLPVGSGLLCVGSPQRLGTAPVSVQGEAEFAVNLPAIGASGVHSGQSVTFQAWFRDANPAPTSNLSAAVEVTFQ
jgi:hypothetical protein